MFNHENELNDLFTNTIHLRGCLIWLNIHVERTNGVTHRYLIYQIKIISYFLIQ